MSGCAIGEALAVVGGGHLQLWAAASGKLLTGARVKGATGVASMAWTPDGCAVLLTTADPGGLLQVLSSHKSFS